jgi:hypothetical protein
MPTPQRRINDLEPTDCNNCIVKSVNLTVPFGQQRVFNCERGFSRELQIEAHEEIGLIAVGFKRERPLILSVTGTQRGARAQ